MYLFPVMVTETVSFHSYPVLMRKEVLNVAFTEKKTVMLDFAHREREMREAAMFVKVKGSCSWS